MNEKETGTRGFYFDSLIDHELDSDFEAAETDPQRPEDISPARWAVVREIEYGSEWGLHGVNAHKIGEILRQLPARYPIDSDEITMRLPEIFALHRAQNLITQEDIFEILTIGLSPRRTWDQTMLVSHYEPGEKLGTDQYRSRRSPIWPTSF